MSIWLGAGKVCRGLMPFSMAATRANGLNEEPACRPVPPRPVARFTLENVCRPSTFGGAKKSRPPTIALTWPVFGSITVMAPNGSVGSARTLLTASSASRCIFRLTVVKMRRPPVYSRSNLACRVSPNWGWSRNHWMTSSTKYGAGYRLGGVSLSSREESTAAW